MFESMPDDVFNDPICKKYPIVSSETTWCMGELVTFECPVTGDKAIISEDYRNLLKENMMWAKDTSK